MKNGTAFCPGWRTGPLVQSAKARRDMAEGLRPQRVTEPEAAIGRTPSRMPVIIRSHEGSAWNVIPVAGVGDKNRVYPRGKMTRGCFSKKLFFRSIFSFPRFRHFPCGDRSGRSAEAGGVGLSCFAKASQGPKDALYPARKNKRCRIDHVLRTLRSSLLRAKQDQASPIFSIQIEGAGHLMTCPASPTAPPPHRAPRARGRRLSP